VQDRNVDITHPIGFVDVDELQNGR
jgi:hypothetical protein